MAAPIVILTKKSAARTVDWIAREGSDADFRVEAVLAPIEIGGLIDVLDRKIPAMWVGGAARAMGLGVADHDDIKTAVQDGILPDGRSCRRPQVKNAALGMVIPAQKSISLLLAHPDPRIRDAVGTAMRAGSAAAVAVLEQYARARVGNASKNSLLSTAAQGLMAAEWFHQSSSTGDPHAHIHLVILSTVPCADGTWRALDARILLAARREAETAARIAIEKSITASLGLTDADWSEVKMTGAVPYRELKNLEEFIPHFSTAKSHIAEILEKIGKIPGHVTPHEDRWAWHMHREEKKFLAEKIEHTIDAALSAGGDIAATIRAFWDATGGSGRLGAALKKYSPSKILAAAPKPGDFLRSEKIHVNFLDEIDSLSKYRKSIVEKIHTYAAEAVSLSEKVAHEKKTLLRFLPIAAGRNEIRLREDSRRLKFLKKSSGELQKSLEKTDDRIFHIKNLHEKWEEMETACLAWLDAQHGWIFSDVSAWIMGQTACDSRQSALLAAHLLDRWTEKSLIKSPIAEKITPLMEKILAGEDMPPTRICALMSTGAKFITTCALKSEEIFAQKITDLTTTQRTRLKIEIDGLDPDQRRAAEKIALGKKFLPISGVAGAGKSYLMKRVADAARAEGLPVYATARNRKRAAETGDDVGARGDAVFSVAAIERHLTEAVCQRGGLLIIDEAALIDRKDWEKIVKLIQNSNFQVVAIGDRFQAQSIDRKGIWHIAHQAAGTHSATLFASRRCQKWHTEHDDLRNGGTDFLPIAEREGRIVPKIAAAAPGWIAQKIMDEPGAIAVTATNAEAAEISAAVQKKSGIEGKILCRYGCKIGIGDRIRTRKNDRSLFVTNGDEFLVEKIHPDGSILAKSSKNPSKSVTLPPAYVGESVELAYTSTIDSAQGITVRRAIVCVTEAMGRSALYSGATRGTEAPLYVMTGAASTAEAADRLTATLARDDVAASLREIGEKADFLRESQKSPAPVTAAPAAVTASQRAARAAPPAPLPTDFVSRLAAIKARQAAAREARQGAAKAAPSGQDRAPEMAPRPRF